MTCTGQIRSLNSGTVAKRGAAPEAIREFTAIRTRGCPLAPLSATVPEFRLLSVCLGYREDTCIAAPRREHLEQGKSIYGMDRRRP